MLRNCEEVQVELVEGRSYLYFDINAVIKVEIKIL